MTIYTRPYTYLIGWSNLNKYYYGVRFAIGCNPSDLWKTYFTSSKYVAKFRKEHGEPDIIAVRKTFETTKQARLWEHRVIKRINAVKSSHWLNMSDNGNVFYREGKRAPFTEEHRRKISAANKLRFKDGLTLEHVRKLHEGRRRSKNSPEHTASIIASRQGSKHSIESKKKMREAKLNNPNSKRNASLAGKISALNRPDNYKQIQSERMQAWWVERKKKLGG